MCDSNLASLLMDVGEKKEAAEIAKEGVRLKPDSPHAYARRVLRASALRASALQSPLVQQRCSRPYSCSAPVAREGLFRLGLAVQRSRRLHESTTVIIAGSTSSGRRCASTATRRDPMRRSTARWRSTRALPRRA